MSDNNEPPSPPAAFDEPCFADRLAARLHLSLLRLLQLLLLIIPLAGMYCILRFLYIMDYGSSTPPTHRYVIGLDEHGSMQIANRADESPESLKLQQSEVVSALVVERGSFRSSGTLVPHSIPADVFVFITSNTDTGMPPSDDEYHRYLSIVMKRWRHELFYASLIPLYDTTPTISIAPDHTYAEFQYGSTDRPIYWPGLCFNILMIPALLATIASIILVPIIAKRYYQLQRAEEHLRRNLCPFCNYNLNGLPVTPDRRCPECGRPSPPITR